MQPISPNNVCEQILAAATINATDSYQREPAIARVAEVLKQPEITQALQMQYAFALSTDSAHDLTEFAVFLANADLAESEKQLMLHHVLVGGFGQLQQMTLEKFYDFLQACPYFYRAFYAAIAQGEFVATKLLLRTCGIEASDTATQTAILTKLNVMDLLDLLLSEYQNRTSRDLNNYKLLLQYLITLLNQCQLIDEPHQNSFKQATGILQGSQVDNLPNQYNLPSNIKQVNNYESKAISNLLDDDVQSICAAASMAVRLGRLDDNFQWQLARSLGRLAQTQGDKTAQQTAASITAITQLSLVDLFKHIYNSEISYSRPLSLEYLKDIITLYEMLTPAQVQDLKQQQHLTSDMMYNIVADLFVHGENDLAKRLFDEFNLNRQVLAKQYLPGCITMCDFTFDYERAHQITTEFNVPLLPILIQTVVRHAKNIIYNIERYYNRNNDPLMSMEDFYFQSAYISITDQYVNYLATRLADNNQEQIDPINDETKLNLTKAIFMFMTINRTDLANLVLLKFNLNLDDLLAVALRQSWLTSNQQQQIFLATIVLILIKAGYIDSAQKILQNTANNLTASMILSTILVAAGKNMLIEGTRDSYINIQASEAKIVLQSLGGLLSLITEQDTKIALNPEYTSGILTLTEFCQKQGRLDLIAKILSAFDGANYRDDNLAKINLILAQQDLKVKTDTNTEQRQQLIMRGARNSGHKMLTDTLMQQFNQILATFLSGIEAKPTKPFVQSIQPAKAAAAPDAVALTSAPKITLMQAQQMIVMGFKQLINNTATNSVVISTEQALLLNKFIACYSNTHANFVTGPAALEQIDTTKHQMIVLDNHAEFGDNGKSMLIVEQQVNGTHRVLYFNTNGLAMSEDLKQLLKQKLGNDCVFVAASCPLQPNNLANQDAAYKK